MDLRVFKVNWDMVHKVSKVLLVVSDHKESLVKLEPLVVVDLKVFRVFRD